MSWVYPYPQFLSNIPVNLLLEYFSFQRGAFGGLSLYGYTTKKDLSGWGSFLFIGLIGILLASIVNIFLGSTGLQFAISVIGVLVFVKLMQDTIRKESRLCISTVLVTKVKKQ